MPAPLEQGGEELQNIVEDFRPDQLGGVAIHQRDGQTLNLQDDEGVLGGRPRPQGGNLRADAAQAVEVPAQLPGGLKLILPDAGGRVKTHDHPIRRAGQAGADGGISRIACRRRRRDRQRHRGGG